MPHFLSSMAEFCRENTKMSTKGRRTMAARKGSPRQPRGTAALALAAVHSSCSPGRITPPGSEINRQESQSCNWSATGEIDLHFVGTYRCPAELQDGVFGQSPPKTGAVRPSAGSQQAPAPAELPRPPVSWTEADNEENTVVCSVIPDENVGSVLSNQLKMLLKVQG